MKFERFLKPFFPLFPYAYDQETCIQTISKSVCIPKPMKKPLFRGKAFSKGFASNAAVNIFGNKVAIVLWKEQYPSGFLVENKDVADSFRKWFRFMYRNV